jgi:bifunctional enzyme CysN/CysC
MTATGSLPQDNIEQYLLQHQTKELLRFVAVGSVDDGKSTLIGRLLHDTKGVYEDQLSAVKKASSKGDMEIDFSLFTDGLRAEREQGITIDVAYRYFSTDARKFIIADTPGHEQYTRNMATGASTADVAIILIDARLGVLAQSRRHAFIASLLGIPHLLVAVNKLDLEGYNQQLFERLCDDFRKVAGKLSFKDVTFVPISAKMGVNVVHRSPSTPWYKGPTLLEFLETVPIGSDKNKRDFRFPVQYVVRPNLDYRGFAGEVAGGTVRQGDTVMVLPSRKTSTIVSIDTFEGALPSAGPLQAVTLRLRDEIDISRGDMLVHPDNLPEISRRFDASVVWLSERSLDPNKSYLLKHTTRVVRAQVEKVLSVMDLNTLEKRSAELLKLNDIGELRLSCPAPLYFDAYSRNRTTGAFVLIDSLTNNTVAAGMIIGPAASAAGAGEGKSDDDSQVSGAERVERLGQTGAVLWLDGPNAKEHAYRLERVLFDRGRLACVIDEQDNVARKLGQAATDATESSARLAAAGLLVIVARQSDAQRRERVANVLGSNRSLLLELASEVKLDGQPLTADGDLEKRAGAVADALAKRGLLLDVS